MTTRSRFHTNNFDLLRIFAAIQVVIFHTSTRFDLSLGNWETLVNAFPGVPIFFVTSGFLISASLERSQSLHRYGKNRLLRILPALWLCIGFTAVMALSFGYDLLNMEGLKWFVAQLLGLIYTPNALSAFGFGSYNGALWTIPVELQFYVVLPILYWIFAKEKGRTRNLIWIAIFFFAIALANQYWLSSYDFSQGEPKTVKLLRYTFLPHFYLFMVGVLLQRFRAEEMKVINGKGAYWLIGYLAAVYLLPDNPSAHVVKLMLLAIVAISVAYTAPGISRGVLRGNDISYGVYIYHGLVHNLFFELSFNDSWLAAGLAILATILIGALSWVVVERPFIRRKNSADKSKNLGSAASA